MGTRAGNELGLKTPWRFWVPNPTGHNRTAPGGRHSQLLLQFQSEHSQTAIPIAIAGMAQPPLLHSTGSAQGPLRLLGHPENPGFRADPEIPWRKNPRDWMSTIQTGRWLQGPQGCHLRDNVPAKAQILAEENCRNKPSQSLVWNKPTQISSWRRDFCEHPIFLASKAEDELPQE